MIPLGFDRPLYILPFDHRGSFQEDIRVGRRTESTTDIAATKQAIYDGLKAAAAAPGSRWLTGEPTR